MSNYNSLKTTIDANIKQNGRQEITGQILNSVLNAMVTTLGTGYQFAGVATIDTNPGTPDAKVFYIANGKGTYTNFSGLEVTEDEVVILYWDSSWHKEATGIASNEKLSELEFLLSNDDGGKFEPIATTFEDGYINANGGVVTSNYAKHSDFIPIVDGTIYKAYTTSTDAWFIAYYTSNNESSFISSQHLTISVNELVDTILVIPDNAKYFRTSLSKGYQAANVYEKKLPTLLQKPVKDYLSDLQGEISDIIGTPSPVERQVIDTTLTNGYINANGGVGTSNLAKHSDFIPIVDGAVYEIFSKLSASWSYAFYTQANEDSFISSELFPEALDAQVFYTFENIPSNAKYFRTSIDFLSSSHIYETLPSSYVPITLSEVKTKLDDLEGVKVYHIKKDGSGDFSDIVTAFSTLKNDASKKRFIIEGGEYDILELQGGTTFLNSIPSDVSATDWRLYSNVVPPNSEVIGMGEVTLLFNPPEDTPSARMAVICPFAVMGAIYVENITIKASNCRYGIHDESGVDSTFFNVSKTYKNVKVFKGSGGYTQAYGAGHGKNCHYYFQDCLFQTEYSPTWTTHDNSNDDFSTFEFNSCAFIATNSTNNCVKFINNNARLGKKSVMMTNCVISTNKILLEDSVSLPSKYELTLIKSGNPTITSTSGIIEFEPLIVE